MDLTRRQTNYVAPVWAAVECVGAGEYDRALEWLEKLPAEPYGFARLPVIPNLDPLRSHPRFQALLRQLTEKQAAAERSHNSGR